MKRLLDRSTLDGELRKDNAATERLLDRKYGRTSRWRVIEG